jgi:YVTN family beta-propeller protein
MTTATRMLGFLKVLAASARATMNPSRSVAAMVCGVAGLLSAYATWAQTPGSPLLLQLQMKIPLGDVKGRIDHMAIDPSRNRLFVAELGNDSIGVVDLNERRVIQVIGGLSEPQGVAYVASSDMLYASNAGDGSVRLFRGSDYAPAGQINLGDDADNIRLDLAANRVVIGYGNGALAVINPADRDTVTHIPLKAHPESFQLDRASGRAFVQSSMSPRAGRPQVGR